MPDFEVRGDAAGARFSWNIHQSVDATPPTVEDFVPPLGTQVTPHSVVSFSVLDNEGDFSVIAVFARFTSAGLYEVVHDGTVFGPQYERISTRTVTEGGFRYQIRRRPAWPNEPLRLRVLARDGAGNVVTLSTGEP